MDKPGWAWGWKPVDYSVSSNPATDGFGALYNIEGRYVIVEGRPDHVSSRPLENAGFLKPSLDGGLLLLREFLASRSSRWRTRLTLWSRRLVRS